MCGAAEAAPFQGCQSPISTFFRNLFSRAKTPNHQPTAGELGRQQPNATKQLHLDHEGMS
jgi:hypothetical protein